MSGERTNTLVDRELEAVVDGRYKILAKIGAGGMGSVYRATQLNVDRDVAIKLLNANVAEDPNLIQRFETEARIISQLRHPNTLKLIDFGKAPDGRLYIVTEFLNGDALQKVIRNGTLSPRRTLGLMKDVCASLVEAHAKGIVHRDLKPANLFVERIVDDEVVKVLDFGIAKVTAQPSVTAAGTLFGTPAYMAPEQGRGLAVDGRADLYSLGVIAFECIAGQLPFSAENPAALIVKHLMDPPPALGSLVRGLPSELEALIHRLLAKDPRQRPATAGDLRREIEALEARLGAAIPDVPCPPTGVSAHESVPPTLVRESVPGGGSETAPDLPRWLGTPLPAAPAPTGVPGFALTPPPRHVTAPMSAPMNSLALPLPVPSPPLRVGPVALGVVLSGVFFGAIWVLSAARAPVVTPIVEARVPAPVVAPVAQPAVAPAAPAPVPAVAPAPAVSPAPAAPAVEAVARPVAKKAVRRAAEAPPRPSEPGVAPPPGFVDVQ